MIIYPTMVVTLMTLALILAVCLLIVGYNVLSFYKPFPVWIRVILVIVGIIGLYFMFAYIAEHTIITPGHLPEQTTIKSALIAFFFMATSSVLMFTVLDRIEKEEEKRDARKNKRR